MLLFYPVLLGDMSKIGALLQTFPEMIVLDGGLATQLEHMGFILDTDLWSAALLHSKPDAIVEAHKLFLIAGAQIIISASYQGSTKGFMDVLKCSRDEGTALLLKSVKLAQQARDEYIAERTGQTTVPIVAVAASCGPYGAVLHDGSEYTGDYSKLGSRVRDVLEAFHRERLCNTLDSTGADVIAIETIPSFIEAEVLQSLCQLLKTNFWVTFCCKDGFHLSDGSKVAEAVLLFSKLDRCVAVGVNCVHPKFVTSLVKEIKSTGIHGHKRIIVYANSGEVWNSEDASWSPDPETDGADFVDYTSEWAAEGVSMIGGCCRVFDASIQQLCTKFKAKDLERLCV